MNESKYLDFVKIELEKKCFKYISCEIVEDDLGIFDKKYRFLKFISEYYPVPELKNFGIPFFCVYKYEKSGSLIESYILDILTSEQRPLVKTKYSYYYSDYNLCCNYNPLAELVCKLSAYTIFDFESLLKYNEKNVDLVFRGIDFIEIEVNDEKKKSFLRGSIDKKFKLRFDDFFNIISHVDIDESKISISQLCKYIKIFDLFISYFRLNNYYFYYGKRINRIDDSLYSSREYLIETVMPEILYSMIRRAHINFDYSVSENIVERFSEIEDLIKDAIFESIYKK